MSIENQDSKTLYEVVSNNEGQYSVWPSGKAIPLGWNKSGEQGCKDKCLEYIRNTWSDMRPCSLKEKMDLR